MKKVLISLILALILGFLVVPSVFDIYAHDLSRINVVLDGVYLDFDVPPQIVDGRTMVPARAIFEALGMYVQWRDESHQIWAYRGDFGILMAIGNYAMQVGTMGGYTAGPRGIAARPFNAFTIQLDVPPMLANGRTLVPLRAIAESFGAKVDWDGSAGTVTIETFSSPYYLIFNAPYSVDSTLPDFHFDFVADLTYEQLSILFPSFENRIGGFVLYLDDGSLVEINAGTIGVSWIRIAPYTLAPRSTINAPIFQTSPHISLVHGVEVLAFEFDGFSVAKFMLGKNAYHVSSSEFDVGDKHQRQALLTEAVNRLILGGAVDLSLWR